VEAKLQRQRAICNLPQRPCLGVDVKFINQLAEGVKALVYGGLVIIGLSMSLYSLARKAYLPRWSAKE
jgi:hypothetical protein